MCSVVGLRHQLGSPTAKNNFIIAVGVSRNKRITGSNCHQRYYNLLMPKILQDGGKHHIAKAFVEYFPNQAANLENLDFINIENLARRLPKIVSAEQLRQVCVNQQQAVIRGLHTVNLYADMAQLSPELDFSFVPIKHLEERIRDIEARQMPQEPSMQDESEEERLSVGKQEMLEAEETGFDCELRNIMD